MFFLATTAVHARPVATGWEQRPNIGPISPQEAMEIAHTFWISQCHSEALFEEAAVSQLYPNIYIFHNVKGNGFVMVAAHDCALTSLQGPVIAWSDHATASDTMPTATAWWLRQCDEAIAAHCKTTASEKPAYSLPSGNAPKAVAALLTTKWGQGTYYNARCPYDTAAQSYTKTGCVATAMAQVIRFWRRPHVGIGHNCFNHDDYGTLCADFASTYYDYAHMPNSLSSSSSQAEIEAVATLMYHCGVSVNMGYGASSSGATTIAYGSSTSICAENALKWYFDFNPALVGLERVNYTDSAWAAILAAELDARRPVIYAGRDTSGGHAFVCDGYDNQGRFHFNWGWRGSYDGYFSLANLNPGGGGSGSNSSSTYNINQRAIIGIQPNPSTLRLLPDALTLAGIGGTDSTYVRTAVDDSTGWTATCQAPWLTISPLAAAGGGIQTVMRVTAQPNNSGRARTAIVIVRQGTQCDTLTIDQPDGTASAPGWYGQQSGPYYMSIDSGSLCIVRPECLGNFPQGSILSHVRFHSYRSTTNTNMSYTVKIFEGTSLDAEIRRSGRTTNVEQCLGTLVRSQDYTQPSFGEQTVALDVPYIITDRPFWVAIEANGASCILVAKRMVNCTVATADIPLMDSLDGRYLRTNTSSSGTHYLRYNYNYSYTDTTRQYAQEYNRDFALSFYVNTAAHFAITARSADPSMGSVEGGGDYLYGDTAVLTATPAAGYRFWQWSDGNTANPRYITVLSDSSFTAVFRALGTVREPDAQKATAVVENGTILLTLPAPSGIILYDCIGRPVWRSSAPLQGTVTIPAPKAKGVYLLCTENFPPVKVVLY